MNRPNNSIKPTFFVPTEAECQKIFAGILLTEWQYGILRGEFSGYDVFVIGISKTNTSFSTALIFQAFKIESAYLIGIAGAYRGIGLKPGDLVCVDKDYFVDEGMLDGNILSLTSEMGFPVCENNSVEFQPVSNMIPVAANTVSWLSSSNALAELYQKKTEASIETMEGAAFGLVTARMGMMSSQIRAISNYCGNRNSQEWNIKAAFRSLKSCVELIVKETY